MSLLQSSLLAIVLLFGLLGSTSAFTAGTPSSLTYKSGALICPVTEYGLTSGGTNFGTALKAAFVACVYPGAKRASTTQQAVLVVPPGTFYLTTTTLLANGVNWFLHLNGSQVLYQNVGGYAFVIQNAQQFVLSGDYKGTVTASFRGSLNGQAVNYAPFGSNIRLLKLDGGSNIVVGRFNFLQSPAFHFIINDATNVEVFQVLVNGPSSHGGTDGMDISGTNIHVHDSQVHGGDECVTTKSPANNILVENIYCEGASSEFGSFGEATTAAASGTTSITNVIYRNIYSLNAAGGFYIKACTTNNGLVKNVTLDNLIVHNTAYPVGIDFYWECYGLPEGPSGPGGNLVVEDVKISNVYGTISSATSRPVIKISCDNSVLGTSHPTCTNIVVSNVNVWPSGSGTSVYNECSNAIGSGVCLSSSTFTTTTTKQTLTVVNHGAVAAPTWGLVQYPLYYYPEATYPPTTVTPTTKAA